MSKTSSWAFPNIINVAQNKCEILEDEKAVVSRVRLLMLTEPTEIYNEPDQGVGLRRYLWQYNLPIVESQIHERTISQLRDHEPYVNPDNTQFADGNLFTGSTQDPVMKENKLEMTLSVETSFGRTVRVTV